MPSGLGVLLVLDALCVDSTPPMVKDESLGSYTGALSSYTALLILANCYCHGFNVFLYFSAKLRTKNLFDKAKHMKQTKDNANGAAAEGLKDAIHHRLLRHTMARQSENYLSEGLTQEHRIGSFKLCFRHSLSLFLLESCEPLKLSKTAAAFIFPSRYQSCPELQVSW